MMPVKEKVFWRDCVVLLVLVLCAVGMLGEVSRQGWVSKADNFPGVTEAAYARRARELTRAMTTEEKVGQLFYGRRVAGTTRDAAAYHLGGVLLAAEGVTEWEQGMIAASLPREVFVSSELPRFEELRVVTDVRRSYVQAVRDGADMFVTADYRAGIGQILRAMEAGTLPEAQVDRAVERILQVKLERGMVE